MHVFQFNFEYMYWIYLAFKIISLFINAATTFSSVSFHLQSIFSGQSCIQRDPDKMLKFIVTIYFSCILFGTFNSIELIRFKFLCTYIKKKIKKPVM